MTLLSLGIPTTLWKIKSELLSVGVSRKPRMFELPKGVGNVVKAIRFVVAPWLDDWTRCQNVTTFYFFAKNTYCSHLLPSMIWTLQTVHGTPDTNTQKEWKRQNLGVTSTFSNRSKDSEMNSCKDAIDNGIAHKIQGSYMRRFWKERMGNTNFKALANPSAGDNSVKITPSLKVETKGLLSSSLRERYTSQKLTLLSEWQKTKMVDENVGCWIPWLR